MIRVDFYVVEGTEERLHDLFFCRLINKVWRQGHNVYLHARDQDYLGRLDDLLWTYRDISFVPHACIGDASAMDSPVVIGCGDQVPAVTDLMVNLGGKVPVYADQFSRIVETAGINERSRAEARDRYRIYQANGYSLTTHNVTA